LVRWTIIQIVTTKENYQLTISRYRLKTKQNNEKDGALEREEPPQRALVAEKIVNALMVNRFDIHDILKGPIALQPIYHIHQYVITDNLEVKYNLPSDTARVPLTLTSRRFINRYWS
jgi:hypothetical protein